MVPFEVRPARAADARAMAELFAAVAEERTGIATDLCTCHVRADDDRVWTRLLELVGDPDPRVRGDVIHAITDSTPAPRVPAVIQALESRHNDPDVGIRRRVRKTLAHYRRTGKVTDAAHQPSASCRNDARSRIHTTWLKSRPRSPKGRNAGTAYGVRGVVVVRLACAAAGVGRG
jgi:hypothetical protein